MEAVIKSLYDAVHTSLSATKTHTTAGKPAANATTTCTCKPRGLPTAQARDDTQVVNTPQAPDVHLPSGKTANVNKYQTTLPSLTETVMSTGGDADGFRVQESSRRRRQRIRKENQAAAAAVSVAGGGSSDENDKNDNKSRKYRASASAVHPSGKSSRHPLLVGTRRKHQYREAVASRPLPLLEYRKQCTVLIMFTSQLTKTRWRSSLVVASVYEYLPALPLIHG